MKVYPMRLLRIPEAFNNPDWIFEPKIDGFRALAYIEGRPLLLLLLVGAVMVAKVLIMR